MSWGHHTGTVHDGTGRGHHADGSSPIDANGADGRDHSAHYLFLIIGTPLVAFLIAASAMFESRGLPIPLVRIGTGAAGLILQTIPFMLVGAMMSAAVSTFVSADALERHVPKSLAGGLAMAMIGGLCLPVCDCMVVPTFANLVRKRLPLPYATALLCAAPVDEPRWRSGPRGSRSRAVHGWWRPAWVWACWWRAPWDCRSPSARPAPPPYGTFR